MSRTALLARLVDDAAVFPPGLAPWPRAVAEHLGYRASPRAAAIGPLLVPVDGVEGFLAALDDADAPDGLEVGLVSRPGPAAALEASRRLADDGRTRVVAVELPLGTAGDDLAGTWRELGRDGAAVWWEVDRDAPLSPQLEALAAARPDAGSGTGSGGAKLRTGGTDPAAAAPTGLLAAFVVGCAGRALPFKLTAGLHHAVRGPDPVTGGTTHGVANVLLATHAAGMGAPQADVADVLEQRDAGALSAGLDALTEDEQHAVRALWVSFGCCGVLDPLTELEALGQRG